MPESMPYPGSPSLSPDAREKVLQTFRHTLNLAQGGRNEEALLGCDFILKMDARFAPARRLLDALRGIASGTVVDLSGFTEFQAPGAPALAPAQAAASVPVAVPAPAAAPAAVVTPVPTTAAVPEPTPAPLPPSGPGQPPTQAPFEPEAPAAPPPAAAGLPGGLDDLSLDDFGMSGGTAPAPLPQPAAFAMPGPAPMPAGPTPLPAPAAPGAAMPAPPPPPSFSLGGPADAGQPDSEASAPAAAAAPLDSFGFGELPDLPPLGGPTFDSAASLAPGDVSLPGAVVSMPAPETAPARPPAAVPPPSSLTRGAGAPDPRIVQFLRQGDEAMARGNVQEAIDLWSRVFLIDLSNEEASQRIDHARDAQAENSRKVDALVSEGIQLYDSGDLTGARHKFLDVLAISESDATARSYLNQIEASLSAAPATGEPSTPPLEFSSDEIAPPASATFGTDRSLAEIVPPEAERRLEIEGEGEAEGEFDREQAPPARAIDARILLVVAAVVLLAIGLGTWFVVRRHGTSGPAPAPTPVGHGVRGTPRPGGVPGAEQHPVDQARALYEQGKVEEALEALKGVPPTDPRYAEVQMLVERIKNSPPPVATPRVAPASLDEMRANGMAAAKESRFIDAVKALDPVVKSHPEDTEAAQELARSRDQVSAMASAVKSFNEQDYESAIKLLWTLRKSDAKNKDVEEYLFKSYFNQGVQSLQAGNAAAATYAFQESLNLHAGDVEAQRHLKFARKYAKGTTELVARIYIHHLTPRS